MFVILDVLDQLTFFASSVNFPQFSQYIHTFLVNFKKKLVMSYFK